MYRMGDRGAPVHALRSRLSGSRAFCALPFRPPPGETRSAEWPRARAAANFPAGSGRSASATPAFDSWPIRAHNQNLPVQRSRPKQAAFLPGGCAETTQTMRINSTVDLESARSELDAHYDLLPSERSFEETEDAFLRSRDIIPMADWMQHAPYVRAIRELKEERDAVILAHNYMTPDIYHGIADFVGDSLQLAIEASRSPRAVIVQCGVHFMAETSKILNPDKTVLIPDRRAGCSLASSITAEDVERMRAAHPGAPVVTYVNTTADVKAASDICCTSSNALAIVDAMDSDTVIMTPDGFLAQNVAPQTSKNIVYWEGTCEVHERFSADEIRAYRDENPGIKVLAHPECHPEVVAESDYTGSTSGMINWVRTRRPPKVVMVTECSMSDNVAAELPEVDFVRPCNVCPHMKRITLENVLWSLHTMTEEVEVDPEVADRARIAVERMIEFSSRRN